MTTNIPTGCLRLDEAFELYRMGKRGKSLNESPPQDDPGIWDWRNQYDSDFRVDEEELGKAFIDGSLEARVLGPDEIKEHRILPDDWAKASWPTRVFLSEDVFAFHDSTMAKYNGMSAFVVKQDFLGWLQSHLHEYFFGQIASGLLTPEVVNERLSHTGLAPLFSNPDPNDFHPEQEVHWTLAMAVAWISWRDLGMVTRNWEAYTKQCYEWRQSRGPGQEKVGKVLEDWPLPSEARLAGLEAMGIQTENAPPQHLTIKQSKADLKGKLQAGDLVAFGRHDSGPHEPIPAEQWISLEFASDARRDYLMRRGTLAKAFEELRLPSKSLMALWPELSNPKSEIAANGPAVRQMSLQETERWIKSLLGEYPNLMISRDALIQLGQEVHGLRANTTHIRNLYRDYAPPNGQRRGRRPKSMTDSGD